jgi:signal transduction histidine kinase
MDSKTPAELMVAYRELILQNESKEKLAAELTMANKELVLRHNELEKCADDLIAANTELAVQNAEKEKRAKELIIANNELAFQNEEKEKRANELSTACEELKVSEELLKEQVKGLGEMMFMTSHKVRQPITTILGISQLLEQEVHSESELKELFMHLKVCAISLDTFTRELTDLISNLKQKGKH